MDGCTVKDLTVYSKHNCLQFGPCLADSDDDLALSIVRI